MRRRGKKPTFSEGDIRHGCHYYSVTPFYACRKIRKGDINKQHGRKVGSVSWKTNKTSLPLTVHGEKGNKKTKLSVFCKLFTCLISNLG